MSQRQIFLAQTTLVHHLLSEIRISYLYTWYKSILLSYEVHYSVISVWRFLRPLITSNIVAVGLLHVIPAKVGYGQLAREYST